MPEVSMKPWLKSTQYSAVILTTAMLHALRAIVQVVKSDKAGALETAGKATTANAGNYRAWLAMSYAQQAHFDLKAALESALRAESLQSGSALAHARAAELHLSLGDSRRAEDAAHAAIASNAAESHAHSILGFVHLTQIDTKTARLDFEAAIERDSFSALPRLGLGLAMIRDGELKAGREQIEIAVALDPSNSLLRSYVGKAYYEENSRQRDELAAQQLELASQLDPLDPTPYFYGAILKYSLSRPAEALADLGVSSELNDDRAVYRSRQLLDADLASRNASQATIYNELGFHQLGLTAAASSLAVDPRSGSAHRFLADIYATTPRHEIARASELLQSQLRQPLGAPPLQTQLSNDVLFKSAFFGPSLVGWNEFNPLFISDDLQFQFFGSLGNNDTYGDQAIVTGLHGPLSFSLSQVATESDGYRPNNDESLRQYDAYAQAQFGYGTSAQLEITSTDRDFGDLQSSFDPDNFDPLMRNVEDTETQRLGIRHVFGPASDLLLSVIRQADDGRVEVPDPFVPVSIFGDEESWKAEMQYLTTVGSVNLIVGGSYFTAESRVEVVTPFFEFTLDEDPRHINAYGYAQIAALPRSLSVQIGASYDDLTSDVGDQSQVNPKLGVIWNPMDRLTLRAAAFQVLKRQISSDQGLEPTQLAGMNQFYDDDNGTESDGGGLAADFRASDSVAVGIEATRRNLKSPFFDEIDGSVEFQSRREDVVSGYLYWLASDKATITFEPRYHDFERGNRFDRMQLIEMPVSFRYLATSGLRAGLTVTAVDQEGEFDDPTGVAVPGSDNFWSLDATISYRLPNRIGTISVEGRNLLDEEFNFQEVSQSVVPRYVPEAQVLLRFTLSF